MKTLVKKMTPNKITSTAPAATNNKNARPHGTPCIPAATAPAPLNISPATIAQIPMAESAKLTRLATMPCLRPLERSLAMWREYHESIYISPGDTFGGNSYYSPDLEMEGWLCPALLRYFTEAPKKIYVQVRAAQAKSAFVLSS